ncbi:PhzF family phenazine biosynthesis protein [Roseomonas sp. CECT 9278]|uniref:PhzF family phenazine biosynthesis protein n=1 Tax=Roseomonas sp. CECT 9278 TaxID=2845823 RepID=UPI001E32B2E7|nr:PhzF family phenazine biosynthesis protein [Roseomonas sp. CECT 9278]
MNKRAALCPDGARDYRGAMPTPTATQVERIAAFSDGEAGGNPAGVMILGTLPAEAVMQSIAAQVGYSETVFAAPDGSGWRARYFAPEVEVDFCGHATIALGAALARRFGDGMFALRLNRAVITVEGRSAGMTASAALRSPPTRSRRAPAGLLAQALALFSLAEADLDERISPAMAHAGADHLVLALRERARIAALRYDQAHGRALSLAEGIVTFSVIHAQSRRLFHARNPFPIGGVYEDPATGAAAAALGGYLRDLGWPHEGSIEIVQGEDMGCRSRLHAEIGPTAGEGVRVVGQARMLPQPRA